jgi:hypothetical protein
MFLLHARKPCPLIEGPVRGGWAAVVTVAVAITTQPCQAVDHFEVQRDGEKEAVSGQVVVEAQDGGFLVLDPTHTLWAILPEELIRREHDEQPFAALDHDAMSERLLKEMPNGFRIHRTRHYVICYNTSTAYAEWCGALYERLYLAFRNYWRQRGFELQDPEWPLVSQVFNSKAAFSHYTRPELGDATASISGYYSLRTNRVSMYDLTGVDGRLPARQTRAHINRLLSRPQAERTVATIIHEATHQLAFNCGLQTRFADIPLWVSEGVAIYFETPDLGSSKAWRTIGGVNRVRMFDFRRFLRQRPADSLTTLISDDHRFRNIRTAANAYAEAWALSYYLIRRHTENYLDYMHVLSEKTPLVYDTPQERLAEFRQAFGELAELDKDFLRYIRNVRN